MGRHFGSILDKMLDIVAFVRFSVIYKSQYCDMPTEGRKIIITIIIIIIIIIII
jgi:hypothetical protein